MNLWGKGIGQLAVLAVALFFFACEDETSFLGLKNPNTKFNVTYVEIPLASSVVVIDTIVTDNKAVEVNEASVLVGGYQDDHLGNISTRAFLQISPTPASKITGELDSVMVHFRLNSYAYGFDGEEEFKFTVHEITSDSLNRLTSFRYYYDDSFDYDPTPLGEATVTVHYDTLLKQQKLGLSQQDTILASGKISKDFGQRIFDLAVANEFKTNSEIQNFIYAVKGLVIIPSVGEGVMGIRALHSLTNLTLHYHHEDESGVATDTLTRPFLFNYPSFTNIQADRAGSDLAGVIDTYEAFEPASGLRYVESGSPVVTKLDLSKFYEFADTIKNLAVNSAELIIDGVESSEGTEPHAALMLKTMKEDDLFYNYGVDADSINLAPYYLYPDGTHFYVVSDIPSSPPSRSLLVYDNADTYVAYVKTFVQSLFKNKVDGDEINANRLQYLAICPYVPSISRSVTRTAFASGNVKLRIYYTSPADPKP